MSTGIEYIRSFDLGGSGLKTALMSYDKQKNKVKKLTDEINLGKCPDEQSVDQWARSKLREVGTDLDVEIQSGYSFGFSLAGLDKLRSKAVETEDMRKLFKLGDSQVASIHDGSAHLLATLKKIKNIPEGSIWNFSIGTGVGFGMTNSKHEMKQTGEIKKFFDGIEPWALKVPGTKDPIWKAAGAYGFELLKKNQDENTAYKIFAKKWKDIIEIEIIKRSMKVNPTNFLSYYVWHPMSSNLRLTQKILALAIGIFSVGLIPLLSYLVNKKKKNEGGNPIAVVFTGGHMDHTHGRLADEVNKLRLNGLKGLKAYAGPKHAGLFGAAWSVIGK